MLFKVSAPKEDWIFEPRPFWRTADFKSSTTRPREGYIPDNLVYVGGFDEINIHLFPRVRRVRVWLTEATRPVAAATGLSFGSEHRAVILIAEPDRASVEHFTPTIYSFLEDGFEPVPSNEFICRKPVRAVAQETITLAEAIQRWQIVVQYVDDLDELIARLRAQDLAFNEQT